MKNQPLAVTGANTFAVTITADAEQQKADALALAASVTVVRSAIEQQDAIAAESIIKGLIKGMEDTRVEVKKPVLDAGRKIDDVAKLYSGTLARELKRIEDLADGFQREENKRLEAARLELEKAAREVVERAEADRQAHLAAIREAADDTLREAAQRAADEAAEAQARAARERQILMLAVAAPKAAGASIRNEMNFELLDIHALYRARPDLVKLEPRTAQIKATIAIPGVSLPGVRIFEDVKVSAKAMHAHAL